MALGPTRLGSLRGAARRPAERAAVAALVHVAADP